MQDRLSTRGSFILCDCNAMGFPIRYASVGFCELFEYMASEIKGNKCGDLVAEKSIRANDPGLQHLAAEAGLSPEDTDRALKTITEHVNRECRSMVARPLELTGFGVVLNRTKTGRFKVIELAMVVCRHPTAGWLYSVGLQTDVTADISVRRLMRAAAERSSAYAAFVSSQEPTMQSRLGLLDIHGRAAAQYLNVKASEMWETLMLDALEPEVKNLSEASDLSTCFAPADCDGSSVADSEVSRRPPNAFAAPDKTASALRPLDELPSADAWKPQCSEASTAFPDHEVMAFSRHGSDEAASAVEAFLELVSAAEPPTRAHATETSPSPLPPPTGFELFLAGVLVGASGVGVVVATASLFQHVGRGRA